MDQFFESIKSFLGSVPGLITVGVCALILILLLVLLVVALVKMGKYKKSSKTYEALYTANIEAVKEEKEKDRDAITLLNNKVNILTDENAKLKKECSVLEKDHAALSEEVASTKEALATAVAEKDALAAELVEVKKRKATRKKAAEKKHTVKKYSREELEPMTKHELMTLCKTAGYDGFYHKSKEEVIVHILDAQEKKKAKK